MSIVDGDDGEQIMARRPLHSPALRTLYGKDIPAESIRTVKECSLLLVWLHIVLNYARHSQAFIIGRDESKANKAITTTGNNAEFMAVLWPG